MNVLLIGAGSKRELLPDFNVKNPHIVTLDIVQSHHPDILADLEVLPYSWASDEEYDQIHAYEVLEHTGEQGDYKFFFGQFSEFHRILKPHGKICATVPLDRTTWVWGDPGHKRVINEGTLVFLDQGNYQDQIGKTAMSDYRNIYKVSFITKMMEKKHNSFLFELEKV